jgi:hypothetical protein
MKRVVSGAIAVGMLSTAGIWGTGVAAGETALIVPGTAPSPYGPLRSTYHFNPAEQPEIASKYYDSAGATRQVIPYPGSLWPLTGMDSPPLGESVDIGTNNLDSAIRATDGPIAVTGLSQGVLALNAEQARLATDPNAPPPGQLVFIKAGDPGHVLARAFKPGTHVPIADYTVPAPVESQYDTIDIVSQYDVFSDPPDRPGNLLADLNAVMAAGYYGHTTTAFSDPARVAPQDVTVTTNSKGATTTTYFIRTDQLPLTRVLEDEAGLSPEMAQRIDGVLRPMVDNAYTRYDDPAAPAPQRPAVPLNLQNLNLPTLNVPALNIPAVGPAVGPAVAPVEGGANVVNTANVVRILQNVLPKKR